ncbi:MAG TPA: hypothetical protein VGD45_19720 [Steroidobacter sp.]|uniref:OmpA family protein n=1 Tax=Steroidobacter sp. TaxID=1978227 RepID=UPI002ED8E4B3
MDEEQQLGKQAPPPDRSGRPAIFVWIVALGLTCAALLWFLFPQPDDGRIDALLLSIPNASVETDLERIRMRCDAAQSHESPDRRLRVWRVPGRQVEDCLSRLATLSSNDVQVAPRVNWLCYPFALTDHTIRWPWERTDSRTLLCPDKNAQFNYVTGLPHSAAGDAPISVAEMPLMEPHTEVVVSDPRTGKAAEAKITKVTVSPGGFQLWFESENLGNGIIHRTERITIGEMHVGSRTYSLQPQGSASSAPAVANGSNGTYLWEPSRTVEPTVPLHSESASAGANIDMATEQSLALAFNRARLTEEERAAQQLHETEFGDAFRDLDGTEFQRVCPADPKIPAGLSPDSPIQLRLLFGYTSAARSEMAPNTPDSAARDQIKEYLQTRLTLINGVLDAQSIPVKLILADVTQIVGLDAPVSEFPLPPPDQKEYTTWVDVVAKDLIFSRQGCHLREQLCEFRVDETASTPPGFSLDARRRAYAALEPAFVRERRLTKADVVTFVVGSGQLPRYRGQAAAIRASFYSSFFFVRSDALNGNATTLEHELSHLLGARHQKCVACGKESACALRFTDPTTKCLCRERADCENEKEFDALDAQAGAPADNHAFTFVAQFATGAPRVSDKHVMLGTMTSDFSPTFDEVVRTQRLPRWSIVPTKLVSTDPPPDYSGPKPFLLSDLSSDPPSSNEGRVIASYAACASRFLSAPEDSFTASVIDSPQLPGLEVSEDPPGPFDAPLAGPALADRSAPIGNPRDAQRTIYFRTGYPFADHPFLSAEDAVALDELKFHFGIEALTQSAPTAPSLKRTLYVEGYADRVGKESDNCALAWRRATATAIALCARIPSASVGVESYGENWPSVLTRDSAAEGRNRRVVISWPESALTREGNPIRVESCTSFLASLKDRRPNCETEAAQIVQAFIGGHDLRVRGGLRR